MLKKVMFILILSFLIVGVSQAKGPKMSLGVNVVGALPMGDFGDRTKTGFGGTATFLLSVLPALDLTGTIGYISFGAGDQVFQFTQGATNTSVDGGSWSIIPLLFGARYYFMPGKVQPYGTAELGLHFENISEITASAVINGQNRTLTTPSVSGSDFGIGFGGGVVIEVGKNLNFDGTVQYNVILISGASSGYVSIEAGVSFGI